LGDKLFENVHSTVKSTLSSDVVSSSSKEESGLFLSDCGGRSKGGSVRSEVGNGSGEVGLGSTLRISTSVKLVGSGSEGFGTFLDFSSSEFLLFSTGSLISIKHIFVLSLFSINLLLEVIKHSENVFKWSTGLDLGLDFS